MANKFVWSGATGLNDGSKWEDAYTSLMRDWGAEAGFTPATDVVYVRSVHAESTAGLLTLLGHSAEGTTVAIRVICVVGATTGTTPGNLATGASVTTTGANDIRISEMLYVYGVDFLAGDDVALGQSTAADTDLFMEQCRIETTGGAGAQVQMGHQAGIGNRIYLLDCQYDFANAGSSLVFNSGTIILEGGTLNFLVNDLVASAGRGGVYAIRNMDLSIMTTNIFKGASFSVHSFINIERCLLGAGATIQDETIDVPGVHFFARHCQIGTDADPAFQMEYHSDRGKLVAQTSSYRTGGASDGERTNPISWDMDTVAGSKRSYPGHVLESPPIVGWTDGDASTAHTYRIYFASGATQQDDDIWFDLVGPNDAATNSLGVRKTKRVAPETAAANHTTDGVSTWTGADVGTKQYMELTYTPDKPGPISAILHMAVGSEHIFVDPKIYIDP